MNYHTISCYPNGISTSLEKPLNHSIIDGVTSPIPERKPPSTSSFSKPIPSVKSAFSHCRNVRPSQPISQPTNITLQHHIPSYHSHPGSLVLKHSHQHSTPYRVNHTPFTDTTQNLSDVNLFTTVPTFQSPLNRTATTTEHFTLAHADRSLFTTGNCISTIHSANASRSNFSIPLVDVDVHPSVYSTGLTDDKSKHEQETDLGAEQPEAPPLHHLSMRRMNVLQYPKYTTRKNSGFERRLKHNGLILDPKVTLRLLRKLLQPYINQAVNDVVERYMEQYIYVAVHNIRDNLGENSITEADLIKLRKSIIQRVALQYFAKDELLSHNNSADRKSSPKNQTAEFERPLLVPRRKRLNDTEIPLRQRILTHQALQRHRRRNLSENIELRTGESSTPSSYRSPGSEDHGSACEQSSIVDSDDQLYSTAYNQLDKSNFLLVPHVYSQTDDITSRPSSVPLANPFPPFQYFEHLKTPSLLSNCDGAEHSLFNSGANSDSSKSSRSTVGFSRELSSSDESHLADQQNLLHPFDMKLDSCSSSNRRIKSNRKVANKHRPVGSKQCNQTVALDPLGFPSSRCLRNKRPRRISTRIRNCQGGNDGDQYADSCLSSNQNSDNEINGSNDANHVVNRRQINRHPKWNAMQLPNSQPLSTDLTSNTLFILGSSANTWLGMGAARGRIYTKHPRLFRYLCDSEDKSWLVSRGVLQSPGVKTYLMLFNQVRDVADSHYQTSRNGEIQSQTFTVPPWFLFKMKSIKVIRNRVDSAGSRENHCISESADRSISNNSTASHDRTATPNPSMKENQSNTNPNELSVDIATSENVLTVPESLTLHSFFNSDINQKPSISPSEPIFKPNSSFTTNQHAYYTRSNIHSRSIKSEPNTTDFPNNEPRTSYHTNDASLFVSMLFTPPSRCGRSCYSPTTTNEELRNMHPTLSAPDLFSSSRSPRPPTLERFDYV